MSDQTKEMLAFWGMGNATCSFVAGRENRVYRVEHGDATYALRLKRPGYRRLPELISELDWLAAMARAGLNVPEPKPSRNGNLLECIDGQYADVISWLDGKPIGQNRQRLELKDPVATFAALGREMARLHLACDGWTPPPGFTRCHWDAEGLLGDAPLWGRFWENPTLDAATRDLLTTFRARAASELDRLDLDTGLIHADLVPENVLIDGPLLRLIDFDDGGFGYRLFDVATALVKNRAEPTYSAMRDALVDGYRTLRSLDLSQLDLFMALRAATYVGWIVPRMTEQGAKDRNARFIKDAQDLCRAYLEQTPVA